MTRAVRIALISSGLASACSLGLPDRPDPDGGAIAPLEAGTTPVDDSGATCRPNVDGFQPPKWKPPNPFHRPLCDEAQVIELADCTLRHARDQDPTACAGFRSRGGNEACYLCAVTTLVEPNTGAIIDYGGYIYPNFAGCIANKSGDVSGAGCGGKFFANEECAFYGCEDCEGPETQDGSDPIWDPCFEEATTKTCMDYDPTCAQPYANDCGVTDPDYRNVHLKLIRLFCKAAE